jgi:hypothetical protein
MAKGLRSAKEDEQRVVEMFVAIIWMFVVCLKYAVSHLCQLTWVAYLSISCLVASLPYVWPL